MIVRLAPRIVVDPETRFGKPTIEGTRVPVDVVLAKLGGGMSMTDVAHEYNITVADIRAGVAQGESVCLPSSRRWGRISSPAP